MNSDWRTDIGSKDHGFHHHAYLLYGTNPAAIDELLEYLFSIHNIPVQGNPDLWHTQFDSFGINEGREVKALHTRRAVRGDTRIFIIQTRIITGEAQNALLKMFEEPTPGSRFFLMMDSPETLLPTLRSRLFEIHTGGTDRNTDDVASFQRASAAERMKYVKNIIDDDDYKMPRAISFIDSLIAHIHKSADIDKSADVLQELSEQRRYLQGRSASVKLILSHIALTLPREMAK